MSITLTPEQIRAIEAHGEETFPNECCGFMLGTSNKDDKTIVELMHAYNEFEAQEKYHRFLITPEAYMRGEKHARTNGLDIMGFYHSHPNAPARPSQYDLDHAWPWLSYVIVSIMDGKAAAITSWVMKEDRSAFEEEAIVTNGAA